MKILNKIYPFIVFFIILGLYYANVIKLQGSYFGLFLIGSLVFSNFYTKNMFVKILFYGIPFILIMLFENKICIAYPNNSVLIASSVFVLGIIASYILKKYKK